MSAEQVAPELAPIKTKLEGIIGELKQLQASGTPTQAQVRMLVHSASSNMFIVAILMPARLSLVV